MRRLKGIMIPVLGALLMLCLPSLTLGADQRLVERYRRIQQEARETFRLNPTNATAAWQLARAWYDTWEFSTNEAQRIEIAKAGIAAAREAVRLDARQAAAYYYLGINLGCLADATRNLGGLKLVSEMEQVFKKARDLEAGFDEAGPDRCLGLLYRDAPGWPISVGSRSKARHHLEKARDQAKSYPENQLNLLEAWVKWGDRKKAAAELTTVEKVLSEARTRLTGDAWALSWADWDRRWKKLRAKLSESSPAAPPAKAGQ